MMLLRILAVGLLLTVVSVSLAADWPRFRGPNGMGAVEDSKVPLKWSNTSNILWKTPIPGTGNSSPVIVNGKVYLQAASDNAEERSLICLDANTGKIDWTKTRPGDRAHVHKKNSLASSTPACDGQHVYAIFWTGSKVELTCYTVTGDEVWAKTLGGYESQHGVGMSPVVVGGNVFVNYDQDGVAEFLCFDAKTGAKRWAAPRKPFRACYSSPLVREVDGRVEIINASTAGITGYDPDTGSIRWNWNWKFDGMALRTVGSPILVGDMLVAVSGDGGGTRSTVVLKLGAEPTLLWEKKKETPYVPGPLVAGEHLYWVTDNGFATCTDLKTGKILWNERAFSKAVSASPIMVGDNIIALAEDGKAIVFKANPKAFEKVAENAISETVYASPAIADGKLYIRGDKSLYCVGKK
jgi:outer membrane protein assembly factor BamB